MARRWAVPAMFVPVVASLTVGWVLAATASAHEIGTTRVIARFAAGGYTIDVVVDPVTLLTKLEAAAGQPRSGPLTPSEYPRRIERLQSELLAHLQIRFDGAEVHPRFTSATASSPSGSIEDPAAVLPATIRLSGRVPDGARTWTWTYSLTSATYALSVIDEASHTTSTEWLEGGQVSRSVPLGERHGSGSRAHVAWRYFIIGFTHIVPHGVDHMLFVLGLFLFSRRIRPLLWQVTAFTVAHSLTLGLSIYGVLQLPPSIVEPLIAVSIAYVAIENIFTTELHAWRVGLVFGFGLLHGLGFAGVLGELGLPRSEFITGLVMFNAGVEAGQLAVIGLAFGLLAYWTHTRVWYRRLVVVPGSAAIALVGLYWTVERLL